MKNLLTAYMVGTVFVVPLVVQNLGEDAAEELIESYRQMINQSSTAEEYAGIYSNSIPQVNTAFDSTR